MTDSDASDPARRPLAVTSAAEVQSTLPALGRRAGADAGDPQVGMLLMNTSDLGRVGVWTCEPGGWPIKDRVDTEASYILSGRVRITDDATGEVREVGPGDYVFMPAGWSGRWDVIETARKVFAIY
ncbi:MAG: hypothetical protein ABS81_04165 [Pseudonocardia sp. SCN 72-86]|mgnify:CR=1 FL=1|nr:MAG: hypothetical protein ABS81_04165 [Pseudonocardia sp. SCN 72-86]